MKPRRTSSIDENVQFESLKEINKFRQDNKNSNLTNKGIAILIGKIALVPDGDKIIIQKIKGDQK
jgi:hypothetical protein